MTVHLLKTFIKDYRRLPLKTQQKVDKQIRLVTQDLYHPGLNARKMSGHSDVWEAKVDYHFRMTFQIQGDHLFLRRVGTHEIYRKP